VTGRGLFAFDNNPSGGPYERIACPAEPAALAMFPRRLASLIARIRFRTIRFADHDRLSNAQVALDLR
jgi:hypothetical protein